MQKINTNVSPIFDDFDENKNYHRILFNSGRSVQARELTQAQSILQNQIERLGRHLFTEGAMVVPGGINAIESQDYLKLSLTGGSVYTDFASESALFVKSLATNTIFKVAKTFNVEGSDPVTLFVDFHTPGTDQIKSIFNENIAIFVYNSDGSQRILATAAVTQTGKGSWVKVQNGVYFVRGMLVKTDDQHLIVSKYDSDKTMKVGFRVNESIVTEAQDSTLYSNATGFPNHKAPGASRLKITLTLVGLDIGAVDPNFIELARFEGGSISKRVDYTSYSLIEQAIAKRNYETHGDYVVDEFGLDIKEHLNENNNGGLYVAAVGGDETKLIAAVKPGIGYVKGYRVENIGIQNVAFDKARDTAFMNNATALADYGQYFLVNNMQSLPDIDIKKKLLLLDAGANQIGTARVRALRKDGNEYRVYIFDISFNYGKFVADVKSIKYTDASSLFTANLVSSVLYDSNKSAMLFPLPVTAIKSLSVSGASDTSYTVLRSFNVTTNSLGSISVTVGANEFFAPVDNLNYFIALTGPASVGTQFVPTSSLVLGGTVAGTTLTINLGAQNGNKAIKVVAPVIKSVTTQKSKTLLTVTDEVVAFPDTNQQKLSKADVYDIISVKDNSSNADITAEYHLDTGQRDSWYENGKLIRTDRQIMIRTVKVTYRYFAHSAGDYFSADSYVGIQRKFVPKYNGMNLADCLDFRPLKDSNGDFTSTTVTGEILKPVDTVRADVTYYLPRVDAVCVSSSGEFFVVRGIPSLTPVAPETPQDMMKIYELSIEAYTDKPTGVTIKTVDNRRYTMRDIGKLEKRISNVEYYTTLSALESAANRTEVLDPVTGNNRFKNGFAVDGFKDFGMAEIAHPEWSASMNLSEGTLMPTFNENGVDFQTESLSGAVKSGSVIMKSYTEAIAVSQPYATSTININPFAVFAWVGRVDLTPDRDFWKDVKYSEPIVLNDTINLRGDAVQGLAWTSWEFAVWENRLPGHDAGLGRSQYIRYETQTNFSESEFNTDVDNLVSTEVLYYMRSIPIDFKCTGFRPYTRLYPFWDSVDVSSECKPNGGNYGDALLTDSNGALSGTFLVPNRPDKKFTVGTSVMRFTDSASDSRDPNVLTTHGTTTFSSGGTLDTRQVTTTNTKVLTASTQNTGRVEYIDPIAQTFMMPQVGGSFVTKIDVFFATKSATIPVTLQLRTASSGIPTSSIVASVTLNPAQVNVSNDGSASTSFTFSDPIFLKEGDEYAIVLIADTQDYEVFIAQQGQNIIGSEMALSKQAYMGVFLTSSNGSTWNPDQQKDMKFTIHRAVFSTSESTVVFNCKAPVAMPLDFNAISTTSGSSQVKIKFKQHGLKVGDSVTISGAVAGNNISAASMNKTHTVVDYDIDTFSVIASVVANATGSIGGNNMTAVVNYPYNIMIGNVDAVTPEGTSMRWEYQYTSQTTRVKSGWLPLNPRVSMNLPSEAVIKSAGDLQFKAIMSTSADNISPCIESSGFSAVIVSPRVSSSSKVFTYVSQDIKFDNPNTHAKFIVGAKLPGSSGMRLYIKEIDTADQDIGSMAWVELTPTNPIANSEKAVEYEYQLEGTFIGYKIKIELTGSPMNPPCLTDIRTLAFA